MTNAEALLLKPKTLEIFECPFPEIENDEVLIKNEYCGICGSDIHFYLNGQIGTKIVKFPFVLGHECSGTVVSIGADVKGLQIGDRVVIEPGVGCGECVYCRNGKYNLCKKMRFLSAPPHQGLMKRYFAHPARLCFRLPETVSTLEGAMIEPLAVGLHAAAKGEVGISDVILILGAGCIGLMTLLACKARGAKKIIVTDIVDNRLCKAKELSADVVINASTEDVITRVMEITDGQGADVVYETAGIAATISQTAFVTKGGGTIVLVGVNSDTIPYSFITVGRLEVDIRPIYRYRNIFPLAIELVSNGRIDLKSLNPSIFDFDSISQAFEASILHSDEVVKSILRFDKFDGPINKT